MPVEIKDALTIMISFSGLIIALLTLVVAIVVAINQNTKK
ncbi:putative holin-like toxin [Paenibacillus sp. alder61]|nr:putative holin-like toxin [Paenibacillus sp. alder61]